jgi:hypothetical protein
MTWKCKAPPGRGAAEADTVFVLGHCEGTFGHFVATLFQCQGLRGCLLQLAAIYLPCRSESPGSRLQVAKPTTSSASLQKWASMCSIAIGILPSAPRKRIPKLTLPALDVPYLHEYFHAEPPERMLFKNCMRNLCPSMPKPNIAIFTSLCDATARHDVGLKQGVAFASFRVSVCSAVMNRRRHFSPMLTLNISSSVARTLECLATGLIWLKLLASVLYLSDLSLFSVGDPTNHLKSHSIQEKHNCSTPHYVAQSHVYLTFG